MPDEWEVSIWFNNTIENKGCCLVDIRPVEVKHNYLGYEALNEDGESKLTLINKQKSRKRKEDFLDMFMIVMEAICSCDFEFNLQSVGDNNDKTRLLLKVTPIGVH